MIQDFSRGVDAFKQGFKLSTQKPILPYLVLPNIVNAILFSIAGYFLFVYSGDWASAASNMLPDWLSALKGTVEVIIYILVILLFAMVLATTFSLFSGLLISPFLAVLSEKIEGQLREIDYPSLTLTQVMGRSFARELKRLKYILLRLLLLTIVVAIIGVIPGLNFLVPAIWFFYSAWMKSIEFCDYAADNNGHDLPATLRQLKSNRIYALGFGSAAYLATMIPIINLFAIPVAVCGGTYLWVEQVESDKKGS